MSGCEPVSEATAWQDNEAPLHSSSMGGSKYLSVDIPPEDKELGEQR